jgi:periplasmic copper chaperone A
MLKIPSRRMVLLVATLILAPLVPAGAASSAAEAGDIQVEHAWARASAGAATTGAAYMTLKGGTQPDSLVGASTPIAASADVHASMNENSVMKMRPVHAVPVPPHAVVTLAPGGYHIMLMGLKQPLVADQTFPLTLTFAHATPVTVDVQVLSLSHAMPMPGHHSK